MQALELADFPVPRPENAQPVTQNFVFFSTDHSARYPLFPAPRNAAFQVFHPQVFRPGGRPNEAAPR